MPVLLKRSVRGLSPKGLRVVSTSALLPLLKRPLPGLHLLLHFLQLFGRICRTAVGRIVFERFLKACYGFINVLFNGIVISAQVIVCFCKVLGTLTFRDFISDYRDQLFVMRLCCCKIRGILRMNLGTHYIDRKSTRLNSSHVKISYAVFC